MFINSLNDFEKFLTILGYERINDWYTKVYNFENTKYIIKIKVDWKNFKRSLIFYNPNREITQETTPPPNGFIRLGDLTTSNFEKPENFVVFECVNRLLELGYHPENIHLERKWKLGRTAKGGKADITIYFPLNNSTERITFAIIECKTFGEEFEKEKMKLLKDGGQLFSYFQQDKSAKCLVLYSSTFENDKLTYDAVIIRTDENSEEFQELIRQCEEKKKREKKNYPCSFKEANDVNQLVEVWKKVYNQYTFKHGIFEKDGICYNLDLKPLKKRDLIPLSSSQGLFNSFCEILRHHNISDNANAFNKMMSLILCKIVDEETKEEDDILDFQVKFGESYEALVDRLQKLYKEGMEKYLGIKDFVYYSDDDIRKIIKLYPQRTTLEKIEDIFKQIKYYTNNEFAFKEVHNKTLFNQNAQILTEVIELIQRYRFKYSHKEQILGDFFELLLNHGVKQSQGQFFTPLPIVRFMIISVCIDKYIEERATKYREEDKILPKILDYACGVAHFLTEAIDEINKAIEKLSINVKRPWEERYIYGIEKDYRLARTAKIACFLNGDGSANIIHGDGLDDHENLKLNERKFDFILTNPPYSISNFKRYLDVKPSYELLDELSESSSEIEVLFIERAKQILAEGGRCAIVLPASILTNMNVYKKARELILKYFEIKAIAEFGSQTFIATGTNTIVLFLVRRGDWFYEDRKRIAEEVFEARITAENDYVDVKKLLSIFISYRRLPKEDYEKFVFKDIITENLSNTEIFRRYREAFEKYSTTKKLEKDKRTRNLFDDELSRFKQEVRKIEKKKFLNFILMFRVGNSYGDEAWYQFQKVVVARSPSETSAQKKYLGYEFSKRRGYEGIEILRDEKGNPISKLYDDNNYDNPRKIAFYIRKNFMDQLTDIQEIAPELKEFMSIYNLPDLFDFEKESFDFQISLNPQQKDEILNSRFSVFRLGEKYEFITGKRPKGGATENGILSIGGEHLKNGRLDLMKPKYVPKEFAEKLKEKGAGIRKYDILMCKDGALSGKTAIVLEDIDAVVNEHVFIIRPKKAENQKEFMIMNKYLFYLLNTEFYKKRLQEIKTGAAQGGINLDNLSNFLIHLPPIEIQEDIVQKIEEIERKLEENKTKIEDISQMIKNLIINELSKIENIKRLEELFDIKIGGTPRRDKPEYWGGTNPWVTVAELNGDIITDTREKITDEGVKHSNVKLIPKNTTLISFKLSLGKVGFSGIDLYTNEAIAALIPKDKGQISDKYVFYYFKYLKPLENVNITGKKFGKSLNLEYLKKFKIPVPPIALQDQIVKTIDELEKEINKLTQENKNLESKKEAIFNNYLFT